MPLKVTIKSSPQITRSNISFSVKSKPSTIDNVLLAIEDLRLVQDEMKADNKKLGSTLKRGLGTLISRFDAVSVDIAILKTRVSALDVRVLALESSTQSANFSLSITMSILNVKDASQTSLHIHF